MHVDLTSGQSIEVIPIQGLKAKHKDAFTGAPKLFIQFDKDGNPDMSALPFSMSIGIIQRNALMAALLTGWSFTLDDGVTPLPLPRWENDEITNMDSFGEIPIDDFNEMEQIFAPYVDKCRRTPDPKGTTTGSSTGTSRAGGRSRKD